MEQHNILRFLFVRGMTATLLVGGLGVEDQQNVLCVIYVSGVGNKRSLPVKKR
jgi:hypothetical protein